jgi:hypothetical protein
MPEKRWNMFSTNLVGKSNDLEDTAEHWGLRRAYFSILYTFCMKARALRPCYTPIAGER